MESMKHEYARRKTEETILRLYSELSGWLSVDEEDDISLSRRSLYAYQEVLQRALDEDNECNKETGLAEYLYAPELKEKIISMKPGIEVWQGELWGVLEVKSHGALSDKEFSMLRSEWSGQLTDGWGEGFVQEEIDCGDECYLYVDFCAGRVCPQILTEEELKGEWISPKSSEHLQEQSEGSPGIQFDIVNIS